MAEAIVSIVAERLADLMVEEAQLLLSVRNKIQQVVTELERIKTFLPDADSRLSEHNVRNLVANVRELAYDAEHAVDSFLLKVRFTRKTFQRMNRMKFSRRIKDIQRKMSLLYNRFRDSKIKSTLESSSSSYGPPGKLKRFRSYITVDPNEFVGFHEDVDLLVGLLVDEGDDCYPLISICGMGGLGKTTLAQKIYNHPIIRDHFSGLAWVSISQKWQAKQVLQRILVCLVPERRIDFLIMNDEMLVENLLQIQEQKKCLVVLDDIWSTDAWDSLKAGFSTEKSLSKLMLTTRILEVAEHVSSKGFIHQPKSLSLEQSWELLQLKAFPRGDYLERKEELGREMVKSCGGLPLAIVILGGILVTKPSLIEWEKVYDDSLVSLKKGKGLGENQQKELFDVLIRSYNDLPAQLKPCFLYLSKFSEDELIEAETLYQLWIAEGIVLSSDKREGETMMQLAESYLEQLVHRSMVKVILNDVEALTKFKSCSLHDLMRDLSLSQANVEDFFEVVDFRGGNDYLNPLMDLRSAYTRQLVVFFDEGYTSKKDNFNFVKKTNQQRYRSMLIFNELATRRVPPVLRSHVASFRLLRVFSLENVQLDRQTISGTLSLINLGRALSNLVYLRYLSVRSTNLLIFPPIQKLVLLQTLRIDIQNDIFLPPWLPRNILSNLGHLWHLYLPDWDVHSIRKNLRLRFNGLSKLETLENFNTNWCEVKDLPELVNLQKLTIHVKVSDVEETMKYFAHIASSSSQAYLRFLALSIDTGELGLPDGPHGQDMLRQLLWDQKFNLRKLRVYGLLPELAQLFEDQNHLHNTRIDGYKIRITSLSLSWSNLEIDPMPVVEKIPTLYELFLHNEAFVGKEMVCSATGFPKLTLLTLRNLPNFEKWRVEEGSMPILSYLKISGCLKLKELPNGLIFLYSLRRLALPGMPSDFCDRLREVNGVQGSDFYKVAHVPFRSI